MAFSPFWADGLTALLLGLTGAPAVPSTVHLALFTTMPLTDGTGGVELDTADGFVGRVDVTGDTNWTIGDPGSGQAELAVDLDFGTPTTDPGAVLGCALMDDPTAGNPINRPVLFDTPIDITVAVPLVLPAAAVIWRTLPTGT